jgi:hypothetical protein
MAAPSRTNANFTQQSKTLSYCEIHLSDVTAKFESANAGIASDYVVDERHQFVGDESVCDGHRLAHTVLVGSSGPL